MFQFLFRKWRGSSKAAVKRGEKLAGFSSTKIKVQADQLPEQLGLLADIPLHMTVSKLEGSLPADFVERIQYRVQTEHPQMSDDEFACKWFELKRFFLMNALLKRTPMFSSAIDDIWHAMLMFTREYQRFGDQFVGEMIHHAPEREPKQMPGERAWFDWVYAHLFEFTPASSACWNGFFRYPLDKERTRLLLSASEEEIAESLFDMKKAENNQELLETITILVRKAVREARRSEESDTYDHTDLTDPIGLPGSMLGMAAAMMFFSIVDEGDYLTQMEALQPQEEEDPSYKASGCSSSGCTSLSGGEDFLWVRR
ncbi:glycine-rich domain-containing protein [Paenibacillus hexagrammi]|uniref:Uncharacterized protein n=1 Tax=Paenibacillus hexagrammi TaxID=2908839 RepID=A0ABY3SCA8_9BACL|nr:hypothetical protein [Paenibacillus sp. YPD9-1]UJF31639.1 hypothetical protein L0M14_17800 [Paenibacillus sp. YPD9-1]